MSFISFWNLLVGLISYLVMQKIIEQGINIVISLHIWITCNYLSLSHCLDSLFVRYIQ